ncbi:hypothetical protein QN224_13195 [Sinorhizobium sp. 8-89]|uniref:hypothetical protein n=1 Tax=Sinorhizobium sp. 7-81 TaxID=3049087 RepID=UPI0024C3331F|nr:hypothetical protein [Sinorhizobium sp. 7-81]MDK1386365.1 hypothetical protein [Sinorhizobium sp. 7-81]
MIDLEDRRRMVKGWRGRRLLACRAADILDEVVRELGADNGADLPPEGGLPPVSQAVKIELENSVANLLRMILALNDGHTSGSRLQRF